MNKPAPELTFALAFTLAPTLSVVVRWDYCVLEEYLFNIGC